MSERDKHQTGPGRGSVKTGQGGTNRMQAMIHKAYAPEAPRRAPEATDREALILKHAGLVKMAAHRLAMRLPPSVSVDDLQSAGTIGLLDAIEKFDPERGVKFRTYADFRIRGAMLDELRSMDWVPRSVRKRVQDMEKAVARVEKRLGRPAEPEEIAEELGVDDVTYGKMLEKARGIELLSLDEPIRDRDQSGGKIRTHLDRISDGPDPDEEYLEEELKKVLARSIARLTQREQQVLALYYQEDLTLREVGEVLELTESRICQIHTQCVVKLRSMLAGYEGAEQLVSAMTRKKEARKKS